ncbi:hypothetical protein N7447_009931 [Penicillium robsamsonii]|uniref:uncharacterized protein n=1 Tax=Penicillium robsamsonii TaxID=1792511 RepID=UPI0025498D95|nr:uncharacterized protein N7447_009931 [Penicillium robsamsonii]KAJ5812908.1 hypothetical protein N7447_009931 [Penicillium robsamsonii]
MENTLRESLRKKGSRSLTIKNTARGEELVIKIWRPVKYLPPPSSNMPVDYSPVRSTESQEEDIYDVEKRPPRSQCRFPFVKQALSPRFWMNLWAIFNTTFTPIREDGAERYVNTRCKPDKIFQSPPTDEVDAAWHGWLRGTIDNDHLIRVSGDKAKELGLPEAVQIYDDPGYHEYTV